MTMFEQLLRQWAAITDHRIGPFLMDGAHSAIFLCAGEEIFRRAVFNPEDGSFTVTPPCESHVITATMMVNLFKEAVPPFAVGKGGES